jgi:hypothetical protein
MTAPQSAWITERNARPRSMLAFAVIALSGLQLVVAAIWLPLSSVSGAGFLAFNALMLLAGVSLLLGAKEVITIDAEQQTIVIEHGGMLGRRVTEVPLANVADAITRYDGYSDEGSIRYYVAVRLKTGRELALFRGSYDGSRDRATVEARCDRLLRLLPTEVADEPGANDRRHCACAENQLRIHAAAADESRFPST